MDCFFTETAKENKPSLHPSSYGNKVRLFAIAPHSTTMACVPKEESLDQGIHSLPTLLREAVQILPFV
jgi:hypothetical protein